MKFLFRIAQGIFLSLLIVSLSYPVRAEQKFEVLVILPLSGDMASMGEAIKNGILFGLNQGKGEDLINLKFRDDGGLPKNTVSAFLRQLN